MTSGFGLNAEGEPYAMRTYAFFMEEDEQDSTVQERLDYRLKTLAESMIDQ